jgi:hypothetical protein
MFHKYVASVSYECCKSRSGCCENRSRCCICYNGCTRILKASVPNVSYVFSDVSYCNYVYLDVVYVSHICCKCFIWMLRMFAIVFKCFSYIFCKYLRRMFRMFHLFFFTLQVLHRIVSKVNRAIAHGCAWEAGGGREPSPQAVWQRGRHPGWLKPAAGALACKSNVAGCSLARCANTVRR